MSDIVAQASVPIAAEAIPPVSSRMTWRDYAAHILARWGWRRGDWRVPPGLYALGNPGADSPVFVTANYTLSFDSLRTALPGVDGYILVLDTQGVNVWCAAGKGTFGTDELVQRVNETDLAGVVAHRRLILPQLGAPGIAAHRVVREAGFRVEYGPVRAADLPAYLVSHTATPEMRRVRFAILDRVVLVPIELVGAFLPTLLGACVAWFAGGPLAALAVISAVVAGTVLLPLLLPWIPTGDFSSKGFLLGAMAIAPFAVNVAGAGAGDVGVRGLAAASAYLLTFPPVTAFLALNFTGATPLTSRTGAEAELYTYIRWMAVSAGAGLLLFVALAVTRLLGV
jgi:hypothetical protein